MDESPVHKAAAELIELEKMGKSKHPSIFEQRIKKDIALTEAKLQEIMGVFAENERRLNPQIHLHYGNVERARLPNGKYKRTTEFLESKMRVASELWEIPIYREKIEPLLEQRGDLKRKLLHQKKSERNAHKN